MKIKEQTRKLAAGCSKHSFEVVDRTDEVSNHTYGKAKLTWFEEIFEEYQSFKQNVHLDSQPSKTLAFFVEDTKKSLDSKVFPVVFKCLASIFKKSSS